MIKAKVNKPQAVNHDHLSFLQNRHWHFVLKRMQIPINIAMLLAKKMVLLLRCSLSLSPLFMRDLEQNFHPILLQHLKHGATKLPIYKMVDTTHRKRIC